MVVDDTVLLLPILLNIAITLTLHLLPGVIELMECSVPNTTVEPCVGEEPHKIQECVTV